MKKQTIAEMMGTNCRSDKSLHLTRRIDTKIRRMSGDASDLRDLLQELYQHSMNCSDEEMLSKLSRIYVYLSDVDRTLKRIRYILGNGITIRSGLDINGV